MFKRMIANISSDDLARNTFKEWWKELGKIVDKGEKD